MFFGLFKKKSKPSAELPKGEIIGEITHYFGHCKAGVIKLQAPLTAGDTVHIKGHTTDYKQKIASMQINGKSVETAQKGDEVGILVKTRVRGGDVVYKIS